MSQTTKPVGITTATHKIRGLNKRIRIVQGGCLGKGTKVLLNNLTTKKVEDIIVGDKLMGIDGKPRNVLRLNRGKSQLFKVRQKRGIDYIVNDEHILITEDQGKDIRKNVKEDGKWKRKYVGRKHTSGFYKFRADNFFNNSGRSSEKRYKGIKTGLDFKKKELFLDPYYLGLWLGDGNSRKANITNTDKEVVDYLYKEIPKLYNVKTAPVDNDKNSIKIIKKTGKYNDIIQRLKRYNLILNKHIPKAYLKNSRETRLELLAGLLDSDGCLSKDSKTKKPKGYYITQKNKRLSDDILLLVRSLGYYTTQKKRISSMKREDGSIYNCPVYTIAIFPRNYSEIPVKIKRKKYNFINYKNPLRSTIKLEKQGIGDYYGFELDGDHLFLLEDFTITHNTSASKTFSIIFYLIDQSLRDKTPTLTSIVSESFPHLKRGAMRDFLIIMQGLNYFKEKNWNKGDFTYQFETGSKIEFFSVDQPDKLRGARRDRLFINEANNIPFDAFEQLEVRTKEFIFIDYNPTSEFWVFERVMPERNDWEQLILTYKDNEALSEEIIDSIEQRKNRKGWWKVYGLGELGEVEGKIYKGWAIIDEIPHEARLERYGLDFGYTNDPTSIVAIYYYNGGYIFDEITYARGLSNKQIADIINDQETNVIVKADSAEPKSIDEIKSYGVNIVPAQKGQGSVEQGIQYVQDKRCSVTKRSLNIIREYRNYLWETDKDGKVLNKPEHEFSHSMDAIRYGMENIEGSGEAIQKQQRRFAINRANLTYQSNK